MSLLWKIKLYGDGYAHDFEQTDVFVRRLIGVTNLRTAARGWTGFALDIGLGLSKAFWKVLDIEAQGGRKFDLVLDGVVVLGRDLAK